MEQRGSKKIIIILILIIILLVLVFGFFFFLKPAINNYIQQKQIDAYKFGQLDLINAIILQVKQEGSVDIPTGNSTSIKLILVK